MSSLCLVAKSRETWPAVIAPPALAMWKPLSQHLEVSVPPAPSLEGLHRNGMSATKAPRYLEVGQLGDFPHEDHRDGAGPVTLLILTGMTEALELELKMATDELFDVSG